MISVLGIPFDLASSYLPGCAHGPAAIRDALRCDATNTFSEQLVDISVHPGLQDAGDVLVYTPDETRARIEARVVQLLEKNHRLLVLGGDHSVTYPILRAFRQFHSPLNVLHLDAHADLYDVLDGNRYSHACPFARAMEEKLVDRLLQVGIRTMNDHQQKQADRFGVEVVAMSEFRSDLKLDFEGPVYLSLDLDVLDPAFVPGISHYEPGGMTTRQLLQLIQNLNADLVGADIVELNPSRDQNSMTAMVAAKLMKEILCKMLGSYNAD